MIPRALKSIYYSVLSAPLFVSAAVYRSFFAPRSGLVRVHLGPGQRNYLSGWLNVDVNFITARVDVWADISNGLPFRDETVDAFYSHHMIEHLPDRLLPIHIAEMYRCLKPGGVLRLGGPNGDAAIQKFLERDKTWFSEFPDAHSSIGGRFVNFVFCRGEHLTLLTESYLDELLREAGFDEVVVCRPVEETNHPAMFDAQVLGKEHESTPDAPHTLIVEARKPA
ncbi:MAG: methyltransferase domain-containing protein [Chloroflexota bacterium]|nr:methyltransferase domain-containing protein [Chloroflexota bacterium]